jgi:hypothetical protein
MRTGYWFAYSIGNGLENEPSPGFAGTNPPVNTCLITNVPFFKIKAESEKGRWLGRGSSFTTSLALGALALSLSEGVPSSFFAAARTEASLAFAGFQEGDGFIVGRGFTGAGFIVCFGTLLFGTFMPPVMPVLNPGVLFFTATIVCSLGRWTCKGLFYWKANFIRIVVHGHT